MIVALLASLLFAALPQAALPAFDVWPRLENPEKFLDISYPSAALSVGQSGVVVVHAKTDELGQVQSAEVLSGPDLLARAALQNVKTWKFPADIHNAAIVYRFDIEPGFCQDDSRSLSRLVYANLVVVSACRTRERPFRAAPDSTVAFSSTGSRPQYPALAQSARIRGVVVLELRVGTDGGIEARSLTAIPFLTPAALAHARQWRAEGSIGKRVIEVYEFSLDLEACDSELNTTFAMVVPGYVRLRGCSPFVNPAGTSGRSR